MTTLGKPGLGIGGTGSLHKGWLNRIIGTDGKNLKRQDAKFAKETRYGAFEISFESSQTRFIFYLTWRSWRLGGSNLFTLPNGVALGYPGMALTDVGAYGTNDQRAKARPTTPPTARTPPIKVRRVILSPSK
jgi:hypothetical protein